MVQNEKVMGKMSDGRCGRKGSTDRDEKEDDEERLLVSCCRSWPFVEVRQLVCVGSIYKLGLCGAEIQISRAVKAVRVSQDAANVSNLVAAVHLSFSG